MRPLLLFCIFVILLDGCIEPFDVQKQGIDSMVIVDGMVTDRPGPYVVTLSYAKNIDEQLDFNRIIQQASVVLLDDAGNSEVFHEVVPGTYQTSKNGLQGVVGRKYHIVITLLDGSVYESEPEQLLPVGKIKKVYYEFEENVPISGNTIPPDNGLSVYIDGEILPEQNGRVRWRTTGISERFTFPELHRFSVNTNSAGIVNPGDESKIVWTPDPLACSGYVYSRGQLVYVRPCECCHCWPTQYDPFPLQSTLPPNRNEIKRQRLTFVPADPNLFYSKYYLKVEQMSLSKEYYEFWEDIKKAKQTGSDLFQTPAPRVTGNIKVVNARGRAMGYFAASSLRDTSFFITPDAIPYQLPLIDTIRESCLSGNRYTTTTKPAFWH